MDGDGAVGAVLAVDGFDAGQGEISSGREERKHNKADSADGLLWAVALWGRGCLVAGKFERKSTRNELVSLF